MCSKCSKWSLPFRLSDQNFVCISFLFPCMLHLLLISFPLFDHRDNIWWRTPIIKPLIVQFPPPYYFPLGLNILFSALFSNTPNLCPLRAPRAFFVTNACKRVAFWNVSLKYTSVRYFHQNEGLCYVIKYRSACVTYGKFRCSENSPRKLTRSHVGKVYCSLTEVPCRIC